MKQSENLLKLTPEERREESRRQIMEASWDLFLEKGYEQTTTRDIIRKTGILNGSLYNRFKSKEEILIAIISSAMKDCLDECNSYLEKKDTLTVLCLPMAIELYLASKSEKIASLLFSAHQSWNAILTYIQLYNDWAKDIVESTYNIEFDDDNIKLRLVTAMGCIGNLCGMYANGFTRDYRSVIEFMVRFVGPVMDLRVYELSKMVDSICDTLESSEMRVCGMTLKEILENEQ